MYGSNNVSQKALLKFIAQRPWIVQQLKALKVRPVDSRAALDDDQVFHISRLIDDEASAAGMASWELMLILESDSPSDLRELQIKAHQELAEMVDMEWHDYCQLNGLDFK
ncbi:DUF6388 family protein [Pseudomonas sp. FEN]|uniref:DUF6388 family protein n=1 Tax=Pseudomonas sp. FEN TaxID=2767468 RepID=UPI00174A8820|nr:DUF6388 family protein [Pseudomonas sp. FEN]CAD5202341.1 hypothetical protein [Pseudomonas sp. FEN]